MRVEHTERGGVGGWCSCVPALYFFSSPSLVNEREGEGEHMCSSLPNSINLSLLVERKRERERERERERDELVRLLLVVFIVMFILCRCSVALVW